MVVDEPIVSKGPRLFHVSSSEVNMTAPVQDPSSLDNIFANGELNGDAEPIDPSTEESFINLNTPVSNNQLL